ASSFNGDIQSWDVSLVEDMSLMFNNATSFNSNIRNWDVGNVTDKGFMFSGATSLHSNIRYWSVGNVPDMRYMFQNTAQFNQKLDIWDIAKVTNMVGMLNGSGLSAASYDATLKGWAAETGIPSGITLGASGLNYCSGAAARGELTGAAHSWTISDAGMGCPGPVTPGDPGNFITVWQAADGTIRIPTNLDYAYLYHIYWEN